MQSPPGCLLLLPFWLHVLTQDMKASWSCSRRWVTCIVLNTLQKQTSNPVLETHTDVISLTHERKPFFTRTEGTETSLGCSSGIMCCRSMYYVVCLWTPSVIPKIWGSAQTPPERTRREDMCCVVTCSSVFFLKRQELWARPDKKCFFRNYYVTASFIEKRRIELRRNKTLSAVECDALSVT